MYSPGNPRTLRVLVVEDEWPARNYLVELLLSLGVQVSGAVATLEDAQKALEPGGLEVDAAFVDIHLATSGDDDAGMALIRELAGNPGAPLFVLATALKEHAIEAFGLGVVDYLLKPFSEERVRQCLDRLKTRLRPRPDEAQRTRIVARSQKGLVFLELDEVQAFEALDRLTFVHTSRGRFDVDLSLISLERILGSTFIRVHRKWLVQSEHIRALETEDGQTEVFVGESGNSEQTIRIPVSREKRREVKELLLKGTAGIRHP